MSNAKQAKMYCEEMGWYLVPIPAGSKAPTKFKWQTAEMSLSTAEQAARYYEQNPSHNMGLLHGASGTCALDVDHVEYTKLIFETLNIPYDEIMGKNPRIVGRPDRGKVIFRVPAGMDLKTHKISWPVQGDPRKTEVVFELRAGPVQDVLPPSIHPDTKKPYTWAGPSIRTALQDPPDQLLELWLNWDKYRDQLVSICPWAPKPKSTPTKTRTISDDSESVIHAYNEMFPITELLEKHGYRPTRGGRWLSPNSSSKLAGVVVFDNGRAFSHHASDPFDNAHAFDSFDVFCYYEHLGDVGRAVRAAGNILQLSRNPEQVVSEDVEHGKAVHEGLKKGSTNIGHQKAETVRDIPDHLLTVPGILSHFVNYYNTTAVKPQPQFAVQAALAFGSVICGRRFCTDANNYTNLYFVCLAETGEGKEHVKRSIEDVLQASGAGHLVGPDGYTSGSAVISSLIRQPTHIAVIDEFGHELSMAREKKSGTKFEAISLMMQAFSRCPGLLRSVGYSTAHVRTEDADALAKRVVVNPSLTVVGVSTPGTFYSNLDAGRIEDGFLNRLISVESFLPRQPWRKVRLSKPSDQLVKWAKDMSHANANDGNLAGVDTHDIPPVAVMVPFSKEADEILAATHELITKEQTRLDRQGMGAMLVRTVEQSMRLALLIALSKGESEISADSCQWAIDYVTFYANQMIPQLQGNMFTTELERIVKKAAKAIEGAGQAGLTERDILKVVSQLRGMSPSQRKPVFEMLCSDHGIEYRSILKDGPGRRRQAYIHPSNFSEA